MPETVYEEPEGRCGRGECLVVLLVYRRRHWAGECAGGGASAGGKAGFTAYAESECIFEPCTGRDGIH